MPVEKYWFSPVPSSAGKVKKADVKSEHVIAFTFNSADKHLCLL